MRVAIAVVLLAVTGVSAQRAGAPAAPAGLIVGQVVDAGSGRPIAGAIVGITGSSGRQTADAPRVLSTSDGRFFFRDLPAGTFTIIATKMGYVDGASGRRRPGGPSQSITIADAERVGDVVVRMWKCAAITGTVVDEMGEPVIGVRVRAFRREFAGGRPRFVTGTGASAAGALTDDRGVYRLGPLVPGDYVVATAGRPVSVSVSMAQELQGRASATTADIGPVALPGSSSSMQLGSVVYDIARGVATPAPSGDGRLLVYPQTFYPSVAAFPQATAVSVGAGEERSAIDLQIHPLPTVRIAGTVVGPEGAATAVPLRMAPAASDDIGLGTDVPTAITDRNGNFEFPAVPTGQYVIRASIRAPQPDPRVPLQGALSVEAPIAVGRSDIEGLVLLLHPGFHVSGQLEFEGAAQRPAASRLQQVPVMLEAASMPPNAQTQINGRVEADGRFTAPGAPPGRYLVRVSGSPEGWMFKEATYRGRNVSDEPFDLDSDANDVVITFTDRWTGLHGVVQGPRGAPDPDATVLMFPTNHEGWTDYGLNARRVRSVRTSRSGDYSVHSIPTGDYYVVAIPDDRAGDWRDPSFLLSLTSAATHVSIADGDQKMVGLKTREVR